MSQQNRNDKPDGPPPPAYGSDYNAPSHPPPAHVPLPPSTTGGTQPSSDYYNASPAPLHGGLAPQNTGGYPPQQNYGPPQGYFPPQDQGQYPQQAYYQQPQMGYNQNPQGAFAPQGYYAGGQQQYNNGYGQAGYYHNGQPQGQYVDDRGRKGGPGFMEACLASLACCCCLDLLF